MSDTPQKIRLAFVMNNTPPYRRHLLRRLGRELQDVQVLVVLTTPVGSEKRWDAGLDPDWEVVQLTPDNPQAAAEWARTAAVDAALLNGYNDPVTIALLRSFGQRGTPVFVRGDSNICGEAGLPWWKRAAKRLVLRRRLRHCRATMPMGRKGVAYFDHYLSGDRPATLVPYEPDYEAFRSPDRQRTAELAQSLQLDPERKRIIFCARLVPVKGVELLIDAFAAVAPAFPDWDVMIAGDGPLRQSLEQRVPADLQARVRFLGHIREPWQVAALYHLSKVMVLPSRFEPWALVVNEAVASGLAVISSDVVGAAFELVRPGVNGYRFTSGDARSLEQALRDTLPTERLAALQAGSAQVLADWRRDADPVQGIRDALGLAGLLPLDPDSANQKTIQRMRAEVI